MRASDPDPTLRARRLRRTRLLLPALWLVGAGACATTTAQAPPEALPLPAPRLDSVLGTPPLDQVQWGVLAVEASSGRVLYERQPRTRFIPASVMKLTVGAAALHFWGPEHRFRTTLHGAGTLDPATGRLEGDLVLSGAGDPTLSARFHGSEGEALRALTDSLRARGVREVAGTLVIDASGWDSATAVASWMVEDLADAATGGAFVLAEGVTTVIVQAGARPGEPARATWRPLGEEGFVLSRVETVATRAEAEGARPRASWHPESRRLVLEGRIALGAADTLRLGTRDPVRQAAAALARALGDAGIRVAGGWRVAWSAGEPLPGGCATGALDACLAPELASLASPPLARIVEVMLGPSHNWVAEQLVRALGALEPPPAPGALPAQAGWTTGLAAVRRYLVEGAGVDTLDFRLRDGSGLSAQNLLTPRAVVQLLAHAQRAPWGEALRQALPEPGEAGTTLASRLPGFGGRVFAKTGTLTNVVGLAGYLVRDDGELVLFAILTNGSGLPASRVQAGADALVRVLAGG